MGREGLRVAVTGQWKAVERAMDSSTASNPIVTNFGSRIRETFDGELELSTEVEQSHPRFWCPVADAWSAHRDSTWCESHLVPAKSGVSVEPSDAELAELFGNSN